MSSEPRPAQVGIDPELFLRLAAPFEPSEIKFRPGAISGNRALALHYVDARVVQNRLDDVMTVAGWQDEYELLPDGSCVCKLRLLIGGQWITKMDVGSPSEQPDEGDRHKAAFSDALKRAAVKFGIGRYLYNLPQQWCDFDPQKKKFTRTPSLPQGALPASPAAPTPVPEKLQRVISDEQHQILQKAISESGLDPHTFCNKFKLDSPENLPAHQYEAALQAIAEYQSRKTAKQTQLAGAK